MQIFIKITTGTDLRLTVEKSMTIAEVKELIKDKTGKPSESMQLIFKNELMEDNRTLGDHQVQNQSTLHLHIIINFNNMQIFVRDCNGRKYCLKVEKDMNIAQVKKLITEKTGTPTEGISLIYGGKPLEDNRTLEDHKVKDGDTCHLILRVIGGVSTFKSCP